MTKKEAIKEVVELMERYDIVPQDFVDEFNKILENTEL